jgi:uncharacterized protein YjhX (UPF0386 family)
MAHNIDIHALDHGHDMEVAAEEGDNIVSDANECYNCDGMITMDGDNNIQLLR